MRRITVLATIALLSAACTSSGSSDSTTTSHTVATTTTAATTSTTIAPTTTVELCRDVLSDLSGYLASLGLGHLALEPDVAGPLADHLPEQEMFAREMEMGCSGIFYAHSPFGEMAQVVAAWDGQRIHAVMGGFIKTASLPWDSDGLVVTLDGIERIRLQEAGDQVRWGNIDDWTTVWPLDGIAVLAGDDPIAALGAWNRARAREVVHPTLRMGRSSGWGGSTTEFTLYPDGELIAWAGLGGFPRTFENTKASYQLAPGAVGEIEAMALATGVTEGETFELENQSIIDAGSLWMLFRHEDVTYTGGVYAPGWEDETPARQQVIDLAAHLEQVTSDLEGSRWIPDSFVVWVSPHGPYSESNTMTWPGSFDLAAAADRRCTLLEGEAGEAYLEDVALIGAEYQDRFKTIFEFSGGTYQVKAVALLPGDIDRQYEALSQCRTGDSLQTDPALGSWLWSTRAIENYRMSLRADCVGCDGAVNLDGRSAATVPGWGELRTVDDLFQLAMGDEIEVVELTTDGLVGIPVTLELRNPAGESLRLQTTTFESDEGLLRVGFEAGLALTGFDEWVPEGY